MCSIFCVIDTRCIQFQIAGIIITGLCSWILVEQTYPVVQDANNYINGFIVLLVVGILLTVVGLLGCCGACKESQCLLIAVGFFFFIRGATLIDDHQSHVNEDDKHSDSRVYRCLSQCESPRVLALRPTCPRSPSIYREVDSR